VWTLVEIVSAGRTKYQSTSKETCNSGDYVLYTDVEKFYDWINRVIMETKWEETSSKSATGNGLGRETLKIQTFCLIIIYFLAYRQTG
jgi:hypothetical protein